MSGGRASWTAWSAAFSGTLTVIGLLTSLGCSGGDPRDREPAVIRLVGGEPRGELRPGVVGEETVVLDGVVGDGGWVPMAPRWAWRAEGDSLIVEPGVARFDLERAVDLDAADLHSLTVTLASAYKVGLTLAWRRAGEAGWSADELSLDYDDGWGEPHHRSFTFDLSSEAGWTGPIGRLRLRLEPARQGDQIVVEGVRGMGRQLSWQTLAEMTRHSWEMELDREVRRVLVVPPGRPIEREVRVPRGGSLVFAVGASGRLSEPVIFRITAIRSGGGDEILFETAIGPVQRADTRRWREAVVELERPVDERLRLRAESVAGEGFDPTLGLPVWASPEIVPGRRSGGQPNIVLISIDTLRADHLSLYGYSHTTSPNIDRWAARHAVTFRNTIAQAPWTLPSHASMLSGLDALHHGVNHPFETAPQELQTLAGLLRREGYFTAGVTGGGWLHPGYGLADGYDRYRYWKGERRGDKELETHTEVASAWLQQLREPFFLFLHSYDVHDFNAPGRMEPPGSEEPAAHAVRHYDRAVKHMDEQLGRFLEQFAASGLRGRTILALTSDHGEDLGEEEVFGHGSLRDPVLLVPLVMELPGGLGAGGTIEAQVRSIDLVPTLLDLAGAAPPSGLDGVSLRGLIEGGDTGPPPLATSYFALEHGLALRFANRWKYLYDGSAWKSARDREALYRLPSRERRREDDLASGHPRQSALRALAARLFEDRLAGLELRLENRLPETFAGTLRGDLVEIGVPRSSDPEGGLLDRVGNDAASFEVAPNGQIHLLFEHLGEPRFELEAVPGGGTAGRLHIDLEALSLPVTFRWTGSSWLPGLVEGAAAATLTLRWRHGAGLGEAPPFTRDPELRRQLEALGYLQ